MHIPFLNLTRQLQEIENEITEAITRTLRNGKYILGEEVSAFENEWARYCGVRGCVGVANGTDAISLALIASGAVEKNRGDEVITTPLTAAYTALAILNAGATPVFADIDSKTYTLDPQSIEQFITPRTKAIVPVHLYGQMADMETVCEIASCHNLIVIEDAAQAHGAMFKKKRAGSFGHAAAFSFYPTKNLGAMGDGGAVVSNDEAILERVKTLRQGGHESALRAKDEGRNSRLDEIQAAILRVKLKRLDEWNERRKRLAQIYNEALKQDERITIPFVANGNEHIYHQYVIQYPSRESLQKHLAAKGVETMIHYPYLLHQQELFKQETSLPVAETISDKILSLPINPYLSEQEIAEIANAILEG